MELWTQKYQIRYNDIEFCQDLVDKQEIESILNFNIDVLCWNLPRCCPRGSPGVDFLFYITCR